VFVAWIHVSAAEKGDRDEEERAIKQATLENAPFALMLYM
jgi:hypothetical protein